MTGDGARWYVVKTKARAEKVASVNLQRQGYRVFLPEISKERYQRGQWQPLDEPLFPGYLFVQLEVGVQNFAPIRSTTGVINLVRFSTMPEPMPENAIETLMQSQQDGKLEPGRLFQPGGKVQILSGAFAGWEGILQAETADERVLVLLNILGKTRPLAFPRDSAAPV
jgi:transcriptional antiterminator RfaH